jgi:hypothetical protein
MLLNASITGRPSRCSTHRIRWTDYRSKEWPNAVRIEHHKTGQQIWHPLEETVNQVRTAFYADAEAVLAKLPRRGIPMIQVDPDATKPRGCFLAKAVNVAQRGRGYCERARRGAVGRARSGSASPCPRPALIRLLTKGGTARSPRVLAPRLGRRNVSTTDGLCAPPAHLLVAQLFHDKHGRYTADAIARRREIGALLRAMRTLMREEA